MKTKEETTIEIYEPEGGQPAVEVRLAENTVWLTQSKIAELFQSSRVNITEHIQHIFKESELEQESTCRKFRQVRQDLNIAITWV